MNKIHLMFTVRSH